MRLRVVLLAVALVLAALPAAAQGWPAQWKAMVEAANREGELVLQSQPFQTARDFLQREWPKAYPDIKLNMSALPEPQFWARLRTERAAGKYLWDMAVSGASTGYTFSKEGAVDPLMPELVDPAVNKPEMWGGWDNAFMDADKKYVLSVSSFIASPYYNAAHVAPDEVTRFGIKAMLNPAYAGKIVWQEPTLPGGGRTLAQLLYTQLGEDGLKKLIVDQKAVLAQNQQQVVEAMARGTSWIGILPSIRGLAVPYAQAGVKVDDLRTFGSTPETGVQSVGGATVYVFNQRPHPNATRVFISWFLSKEVQNGFAIATQQASRRTDVPHAGDPDAKPIPGAKYITPQREESFQDLVAAAKQVDELRKSVR